MIQLTLSEEDAAILRTLLEVDLSDLRMEVAGTDSYDYRAQLKAREEALRRIIAALPAPPG